MRKQSYAILSWIVAFNACGGEESGERTPQLVMETEHLRYYASPGDVIDSSWQEAYYDWLVEQLEVTLEEKLEYYKYINREHLEAVTGRETNGFAEIGTYRFHTIWKIDNHECVHTVVTQIIGHPPALFSEGIAVAHQADYFGYPEFVPAWNGHDFDQLSKGFLTNGNMPSLAALTESTSFFSFDANMTYPIAGSFVRYLINTRGMQALKRFIAASSFEDDRVTVESLFQSAYSASLADLWDAWRAFLAALP